MKKIFLSLLVALPLMIFGQGTQDYAVQIEATLNPSVPEIRLDWKADPTTTTYNIYRKHPDSTAWGSPVRSQSGIINLHIDRNIQIGQEYEYRVERITPTKVVNGYIQSGIEVPAVETRGKLLLIVDLAYASNLAQELKILINDLEGDGWHVIRKDIHNAAPDTTVKNFIDAEYNKDKQNVKAVYLFGHLAVPYSGGEAFDGQTTNHEGAWSTDTWYADHDGIWTDLLYHSNWFSQPARTQNIRNDGKWDQSFIPSGVEFQIGRVDFSDLSFFSMNEWQLMKNYIIRSHQYKTNQWNVPRRALLVDSIGVSLNSAKSAAAYRTFYPIVGDNIDQSSYRGTLDTASYLMSYANGTGTYVSLSSIGTSNNLASDSLRSVFHMLYGDYFGDWDIQNNMLRASIAQGYGLASFHHGDPEWVVHPMGLGQHIGRCAEITMNNDSLYASGNWMRGIHINLMGDPTLRAHMIAPVSSLLATDAGSNRVALTWTASPDVVQGYHVYRKKKYEDFFDRINKQLITGTSFMDSCVVDSGDYVYMVRGSRLETTPSGSYYNLSLGIFDSLTLNTAVSVTAGFSESISGATLTCTNSASTNDIYWDFGDGNTSTQTSPQHTYAKNGTYTITQVAIRACNTDTLRRTVDIDFYRPLPATNLTITDLGANYFRLDWNHSASFINGYNVWRREVPSGFFQILTTFGFYNDNFFNDSCLVTPGDYEYMVSAYKRDTFATGIKPNFSDSLKQVINITNDYSVKANFSYSTNEDTLFLTNTSQYADSFYWDLDNGFRSGEDSPIRIVGQNGPITIKLLSVGPCGADSTTELISFQTIGLNELNDHRIRISPNPSDGNINIRSDEVNLNWKLFSTDGKLVDQGPVGDGSVSLGELSNGIYFIEVRGEAVLSRQRLLIIR
jgi:PKD repeat protein